MAVCLCVSAYSCLVGWGHLQNFENFIGFQKIQNQNVAPVFVKRSDLSSGFVVCLSVA